MRTIAYSFKGQNTFCLAAPIPQLEGAPETWVHVASEGKWYGHPNGAFEFTVERFEECVRNFHAKVNPIKLDFDHETIFDPPPLPARGWVTDLEIRKGEDGKAQLWAKVQFGDEAAELVRSGGMPFCSGVFEFDHIDNVTGENVGCCMTSLSLTAQPFLDGNKPIVLSQRALTAGDKHMANTKEERELAEREEEEKKERELEEREDEEKENDEELALAERFKALSEKLGLSGDELVDKLEEKLEALETFLDAEIELKDEDEEEEPASELPLSRAASSTIKALSERIKAAEAQLAAYAEKEADQAVSELIENGYLLENGRAQMKALYLSDRKAFDALKRALPKVVPTGKHASALKAPKAENVFIDESDPEVKAKRVFLSQAGLSKEQIDMALKREAANKKRI